jgi:predicted transcriptional regulator of viral defense system
MSCSDIPDWHLRRRIAVLDVRSEAWRRVRPELLPPGYSPDVCMRRLVAAGRLRRLKRGAYLVVDPVRETPSIAVASALYAEAPHYVTTDAALVHHGLIDQPVPTITVALGGRGRPVTVGGAIVRSVALADRWLGDADAYPTTVEGFAVRVASREQAVVDALAEPAWMIHGSLLPEVVAAFTDEELGRTADRAVARLPCALASLRPVRAVRLRPGRSSRGAYSTRWRVYG